MPEITRPSGVTITVPETLVVSERATSGSATRGARKFARGPVPISTAAGSSADTDALLTAIQQQDMRVLDSFELQPTLEPTPPSGVRRSAAVIPPNNTVDVAVDIGGDEDSVLLLEQDGVYAWQFAESTSTAPQPAAAPGIRGPATSRARRAHFRVAIRSEQPPADAARRGLVTDFIYEKVRVYAIKFAAGILVGQTVKFLERNVHTGLVNMSSLDIQSWAHAAASQFKLPADRPARILLFVHGTFSSTVGSFGALCATPWGHAFLSAAAAHYDAIIGFDHATLGDDPMANASELLNDLESLGARLPPQIDAIAFSRGGLVLRSLIERLLPNSSFKGRVRRAIFVGCTNGGTKLADPENWRNLLDVYTNAAVAAFRLLSLLPQMQAPAVVLKELVQSVGAFVKYLAMNATSDVPGLAAMRPGGDFVQTLNQTQPGQPGPADSFYYAVTSEFKPRLIGGDAVPKEFPLRLVAALANGLVDNVMHAANDLVVDTGSMISIDPDPGGFIKDTLAFGTTPRVYHTCYFVQPEVASACTRWLEIPISQSQASAPMGPLQPPAKRATRGAGKTEAAPVIAPAPLAVRIPAGVVPPVTVDTDIVVAPAASNPRDVVDLVQEKSPSYVVLTRPYAGQSLLYAFRSEEILERAASAGVGGDLTALLNLHESDASSPQSTSSARPVINPGAAPVAQRAVVLADGRPLGVVPETTQEVVDVVELARRAARAPSSLEDRVMLRRVMPTFAPPESPTPTRVTCHFGAEMDPDVELNHVTTVEITASREDVPATKGRLSASGSASVAVETEKLIVQVIPKMNFTTVGDDRAEIDVPRAGEPVVLYFDLRATDVGDGEVWVIARQRQSAIVRLVLRPAIVQKRQSSGGRARAEANAAEAPALDQPLNQFTIIEQINGPETRYFYEVEFPGLNLFRTFSSDPLKVDRNAYVSARYKEIEDRWISTLDPQTRAADVQAFTRELQALGTSLFEQLLPPELQRMLWDNRDLLQNIRVVSTEPFIPWELLHLKQPGTRGLPQEVRFLGQMGLVRWLHNVDGLPPKAITIHKDKTRFVIPEYNNPDLRLPEAQLEREFLEREFNATAIEPEPNRVRKILEQPGSFDVLHFACHGEAASDNIGNAQIVLGDRIEAQAYVNTFLSATTVEQFANLRMSGGGQPVVVLNACQLGRSGYRLTGIGGFAEAFLRAGAGLFVGALWSVGDLPARNFTEEFYKQLKAGNTIAEAAVSAREKSRSVGDATWLAYVVYGHPHGRISLE